MNPWGAPAISDGHTSPFAFSNSLKFHLTSFYPPVPWPQLHLTHLSVATPSSYPLVPWPHLPCVLSLPPGLCPSLELMSPGCLSDELKASYDFATYSAFSFYWGRNDGFCSFLHPKQSQIPLSITTIGL